MAIKSKEKTKEKDLNKMATFSFTMPIVKCYKEIVKGKDGKDTEVRFIEGVASSTDVDLHGDQMAPSAIKSMAATIKQHIIGLNAEHDKSWQSDLGDVVKLSVDKKNKLIMKAQLDITSKANDLWYALTTKKKELGLSIGGFVKDYKLEWDKKKERFKRIFKEIELDHIAVTSTPANPKTWVGAISKSVDKVERQNEFKIFDFMSKEMLVKFIEGSLKQVFGEDNLKQLLTNFSLNLNEETIMAIKKQSSLKSDELEKKSADKSKEDKKVDKQDSENSDNEDDNKADDEEDDTSDEDSSEDDKSDEDDSDGDDSEDESADESDNSDDDDSDDDKSKDDSKDDEEDDEDEEKSLTRDEIKELVSKGVSESIKGFFGKLFGKADKDEDAEDKDKDEETDKSKGKSGDDIMSLLTSMSERQEKIEKMLKKRKGARKTTKSVAIDKEEKEEEADGVYKTLDEELDAIKKEHSNDPDKIFVEAGKARTKWAEKEE